VNGLSFFPPRRPQGGGSEIKNSVTIVFGEREISFSFFLSILLQVNRHRRQVTRRFQTYSRNNRNFSPRWINSTKWLERPRTLSEVLDSVSHRLDFISLVKPRPFTLRRHARLSLTFVFYFLFSRVQNVPYATGFSLSHFCRLGATCVCVFSFLPAESKLFVFHDFQENKMTFLFRGNFLIKSGVQNHLKKMECSTMEWQHEGKSWNNKNGGFTVWLNDLRRDTWYYT
jgi:hypothetical protein